MMGLFDQEKAMERYIEQIGNEKKEEGRLEGHLEGRLEGAAEEIVETGFEFAMPKEDIIKRLQSKLDISIQKATEYFNRYGHQAM